MSFRSCQMEPNLVRFTDEEGRSQLWSHQSRIFLFQLPLWVTLKDVIWLPCNCQHVPPSQLIEVKTPALDFKTARSNRELKSSDGKLHSLLLWSWLGDDLKWTQDYFIRDQSNAARKQGCLWHCEFALATGKIIRLRSSHALSHHPWHTDWKHVANRSNPENERRRGPVND